MSRFVVVDGTTGIISATIVSDDPSSALLHARDGEQVRIITDDGGAFINNAVVKVNLLTGDIVYIADETTKATGHENAGSNQIPEPR